MRGGKGLTQKTRNTQNHAELDFFQADDSVDFRRTSVKHYVNKREIRRCARYACATIRMASTNKVCALLWKSVQSE